MVIKNYHKRLLYLALTKPGKIPAMHRLYSVGKKFTVRDIKKNTVSIKMPQTIAIIPTYRCNLNCVSCGQRGESGFVVSQPSFTDKELTTGEIKSFIEEVAHFKPYIYFTGGEPLLRDDIFELISFASSKSLLTGLNTNCTLLANKADEVIRSGLEYIYASLDAPEMINDHIRVGKKPSSSSAVAGIKAVEQARRKFRTMLPIIEIRSTIMEENAHTLLDMARYVDSILEADVFSVALLAFTRKDLADGASELSRSKLGVDLKCWRGFIRQISSAVNFKMIGEQLSDIKNGKWNFVFKQYPPLGAEGLDMDRYFMRPEIPIEAFPVCAALYAYTTLLPNGDIATCSMAPDYIAGNILKEKFMNIWAGENYKRIRDLTGDSLLPTCLRCLNLFTYLNTGGK